MARAMRLGTFVVATLVLFGAGVFWIGSGQFQFTSTYKLNAEFQNVAGLTEGASVRVGGIHQGTVRRIILPERPDRKVRVEMNLKEATRNVIKKDSVAAIKTEGLVGDQYVEIAFGSPGAPEVNSGDTIAAEQPLQISDMIRKTNAILDSAKSALKNLDQTTTNLEAISSKVNNGKGSAGAFVNDRKFYQSVNEAAANLQEDSEALKHNFLLRGFFKNRGYEDTSELTRHVIAQLPARAPSNRFAYPGAKLFARPDSAKIKDGKMLANSGRFLEQNQYGLAVVATYADAKGDSEKQLQLTKARSAVVREYLAQHFKLDDARLKAIGLGKSSGSPDGGTVEVLAYPEGTAVPAGKAPPPGPEPRDK